MGQLTTIAGLVSGVRMDTNISVSTTTTINNNAEMGPSSTTSNTVVTKNMAFRIDNRPANINCAINLTNGDLVTAAGFMDGEFEVLALHNHTTRTIYTVPGPNTVAPIIYVIIGVFTTGLYGIGWLLIGGGIWFFVDATKKKGQLNQAYAIVKTAPVPNSTSR